ncbi:MAG: efflux RND transporter permease subunit [Deltaproteobacteria bacterium]|nr:MAG: efflux RND transporter permease subunit [Deltaproteobacteria bacterium]
MWLTRLALRNPVLILMMSLMTLALGFVSVRHLSVDLFPDITVPLIRVAIFYTGAGPVDIEKSITMPVERAVSASPGVDRVESVSKQGVSLVSVWFQFGTNLDNAQFDVSQRIAQIMNALPPGIQQPFNIKFDITNIPVTVVAVGSDELDEKQLYDLALNTIEPQLERIPGVASANPGGGKVREIEVQLEREALRARGLGPLEVVNAVRTSNLLMPSGNLRVGDRDYNVFANTQFQQAKPLGDVVVRPPIAIGNRIVPPVRISDVAQVRDSTADQNEIVRINGQRGVYLRVLKQPGANSIGVVDAVRAALPKLRGVPPTVKLAISFDQSSYIRAAVKALEHEAVQGGILAILVILVFLVSLRATAIVAVAIPLSIVATFVLLFFSGQTLNVFTLGGLALGVGRLVDDSIVELENIHRHLALGQNRRQAVLSAAQEVAMPILVSTITTIVVFFPVLFLFGIARNLFLPLALTISFALIMSFFVSRTVTPLLCLMVMPGVEHEQRGFGKWFTEKLERLDDAYAGALTWVLHHRGRTILVILAFFAGSLFLSKRIGTEFFPESDESQFQLTYKTPIGTRVERTEQVAIKLEKAVKKALPGLYTTMITDSGLPAGRTAIFSPNTGPHAGNLQVNLLPTGQRNVSDNTAAERLRSEIQGTLPGTQLYFFVGGIVKRILNFGSAAPIDVEILGYDLEQGALYARQVHEAMRALFDKDGKPLLTDVQISREENYPELDVVVDREKAGRLGLSEQDIATSVLTSLTGSSQLQPTQFIDPVTGNEYFINVRMDDRFRSHVADLEDISIRTPAGNLVSLASIAKVKRSSGPVLINRKYLQRIIDVTANVAPGKDLGSASAAVERALRDLRPPEGFSAGLSGQAQAQKEAFSGLSLAALMAIALVYMVLASQFRSLLDPLVIMFSVPLGVSGVFLALWITGTTLSVNSFMGIIMMVGIVVSNGVLLVDFANVLRERDGLPIVDAVVRAGRTRLRPILMTTIATIVGLIPMAIGIGEGSETNLPLARAVIGGLTVSTFFTLFLVPALYSIADRWRKPHPAEEEEDVAHAPA